MQAEQIFQDAFESIVGRKPGFSLRVVFSGKFSKYNAKIVHYKKINSIELRLSKDWQDVSSPILKGMAEELLCRLFTIKKHTYNIELYRSFLRNLDTSPAEKNQSEPELYESFSSVNEEYFNNKIDLCNLRFGRDSKRTLGSYNFHTNTITISKALRDAPRHVLDYVMYHEMLHKQLKFESSKNRFHTKEFKEKEALFRNSKEIEKELARIARRKPQPRISTWFRR
ncbi:MAG TPA: M48 family peptidase [Candidatus Woesearchaeota archaeon]|nr:M48 family peptidase [Candidatus Woesearchaeota archaeon]